MKTIFVKYVPATETKPSKLKAWDGDGNSITIGYHSLDLDPADRPLGAAKALCCKKGWSGIMVQGSHGETDCFTFVGFKSHNLHTVRYVAT